MKKLKPQFNKLSPAERLHGLPVPVVGLTGGIASGKSTVAKILKLEGIPVIDADQLVKRIYQSAQTKEFIRELSPEVISGEIINFSLLREKFFTDTTVKEKIESWIYQRLPEAFLTAYQELASPPYVVYDVPLLFEKKLQPLFDLSVLVYAPRKKQSIRLQERDDISEELSENILNHQLDMELKKSQVDLVIDNSGPIEQLVDATHEFLQHVLE